MQSERLPPSDELVGQTMKFIFPDAPALELSFISPDQVVWKSDGKSGAEDCEVIEVAPDVFFIDLTFMERPRETLTVVVDMNTRHALQVRCVVREEADADEPPFAQIFQPGVLEGAPARGDRPEPVTINDRSDGDVATNYRFAPGQYVFAGSEHGSAVASVLFLDFKEHRTTGKFLGITADGRVTNTPVSDTLPQIH